jgi:hypothetical protein
VAAAGEPLVHALDLAFAKARRAARPAGEAPVDFLDVGGDQVFDSELLGDRAG